jgi:hypothetical protein
VTAKKRKPVKDLPPKLSDERMRQIALAYVEGRVYSTADVPQQDWKLVFMPIVFADKKMIKQWEKEQMAHVYAIAGEHKTAKLAVNGIPIFFQCGTLSRSEWKIVVKYVEEFRAKRAEMLGKT